jgi:hypothetical protein
MIALQPPPYVPHRVHSIYTVGTMYSWIPTNTIRRTVTTSTSPFGLDVLFPNAESALTDLFSIDPAFSRFAQSVLSLRTKEEGEPEEDLPATAYSVVQVFYLTPQSRFSLSQAWQAPVVVTDGYGGIRMTWRNRDRDVRVAVPGNEEGKRRLYWEEGDSYGSIPDVTPTTLTKYLRWMTNGTRHVAA